MRLPSFIVAGDGGCFKVCASCETAYIPSSFGMDNKRPDGLNPYCRECRSDIGKKYYKANPERVHAANQRWKDENPDKVAAWKAGRVDESRQYQRDWRERNRDKLRERARLKSAEKRLDPKERLDNAISCGIRGGVVRGSKRRAKWETLVGYTVEDLMTHLESQFTDGMAWENYGRDGWHVDHIMPRSAFNYETPQDMDFKRCWALNNLQPLWQSENCSKNNKIDRPFQPSLLLADNDNDRLDGLMQPKTSRARST